MTQTTRVERIVRVPGETITLGVVPAQTAERSNPQRAVPVCVQCAYLVVNEAVGVCRVVLETPDCAGGTIKTVQAVLRCQPKIPGLIFCESVDEVIAQGLWIVRVVTIANEAVGQVIIAVQTAAVRSDPERSSTIDV